MHRCLTGSTGAEGIFSWMLTSLHRWYAPMHRRLNRCLRNFFWALDTVSGTKDGHCTDALSWTVGSTGAEETSPGRLTSSLVQRTAIAPMPFLGPSVQPVPIG